MNHQHLTKISDLQPETLEKVMKLAFDYKRKFDMGLRKENILNGKMVAMVFEKPSLRTKVAFEIATEYLGGTAVYLSDSQILASGSNIKGRESIPDIARNLERFSDLILARVYSHKTIEQIARHTTKPVINALCDRHHPTQALADLMALRWHKPDLVKAKVAYIGDGNNVATSLMQIMVMAGHEFTFAGPKDYQISQEAIQELKRSAQDQVKVMEDPREAIRNADVVYTDTYVSMGDEAQAAERLKVFAPYQVNQELFDLAKPDAIFMHCLPAHRGEEVSDEVIDHPRSVVFDQAECRMHVAKALLTKFLNGVPIF